MGCPPGVTLTAMETESVMLRMMMTMTTMEFQTQRRTLMGMVWPTMLMMMMMVTVSLMVMRMMMVTLMTMVTVFSMRMTSCKLNYSPFFVVCTTIYYGFSVYIGKMVENSILKCINP